MPLEQEAVIRLIVVGEPAYDRATVIDRVRVSVNCTTRVDGSEDASYVGKAMDCEGSGVQVRSHHVSGGVDARNDSRTGTGEIDLRPGDGIERLNKKEEGC